MPDNKPTTRREFLRSVARYGMLALLGGGVGALTARRRETCENHGVCRGCTAFDDCGLPQALSAKQAGVEGTTWRKTPAQ